MSSKISTSSFPVKVLTKSGTEGPLPSTIQLSTSHGGVSEIILDYGRAVGGIPFFETANVGSEGVATLEIIYSETRAGVDKEKGIPTTFETEFLANSQQAMDHSCYFPTQWTHTESTHIHSRLPKRLHMWKQDSLKNLKDSRNSSLNRQTPRSYFPPSVSDIKGRQPSRKALSSAQTSCSIGFGMTELEQLICVPWTPERPLKHGILPRRER